MTGGGARDRDRDTGPRGETVRSHRADVTVVQVHELEAVDRDAVHEDHEDTDDRLRAAAFREYRRWLDEAGERFERGPR